MNITIPPAAIEAGAKVIQDMRYATHLFGSDDIARAAFEAMVGAWPGMEIHPTHAGYPAWPHIILPLPTENPDGE